MSHEFKFAFIAICLIIALFSCAMCHSKKDWGFLVGGLAFTIWADYFLVLRNEHTWGVAVFCFVHVCYILRAAEIKKIFSKKFLFPLCAFFALWITALISGSVIVFSGLYAFLFITNIFVNLKARRPKANYFLVLAGLILFALCDISVMLFNLPRYTNISFNFPHAFTLIWVFYLPSQLLLAVSAVDFNKYKTRLLPSIFFLSN